MGLRSSSRAVTQNIFRAGKPKYEAPKFLSSTLTPPPKRRPPTRSKDSDAAKKAKRPSIFRPAPISASDISEIPFRPINHQESRTIEEQESEDKENVEEWIERGAEEYRPEALAVDPFTNDQPVLEFDDVEEARDIAGEIEEWRTKICDQPGSSVFLHRRIPKIEKMLSDG